MIQLWDSLQSNLLWVVIEWKAIAHKLINADSGEWAHEGLALPIILSPLFLCVLETFHNKKLM